MTPGEGWGGKPTTHTGPGLCFLLYIRLCFQNNLQEAHAAFRFKNHHGASCPRSAWFQGSHQGAHSRMVPLGLGRLPELPCTARDTGRCLASRSPSTRGPSPAKCLKAAASQRLMGAAAGPVEVALPCSAVPGGQRWTGAAGDRGRRRGQGPGQGQVRTGLPAGTAAPDTPAKGRRQMSREGQLQGRVTGPTPGAAGSPAGTPALGWHWGRAWTLTSLE